MALIGGGVTGLASLFGNDDARNEGIQAIMDNLMGDASLSETAFSKSELLQKILPIIQQTYRGGANVAAGQIGAALGESGMNQGQNFAEYYTQALAPVIAQGENLAGNANQQMVEFYGNLDNAAKQRKLSSYGLQMQGAMGMTQEPSPIEKFMASFLQGANLGATAAGNIGMADYYNTKNKSVVPAVVNNDSNKNTVQTNKQINKQINNNNVNMIPYDTGNTIGYKRNWWE